MKAVKRTIIFIIIGIVIAIGLITSGIMISKKKTDNKNTQEKSEATNITNQEGQTNIDALINNKNYTLVEVNDEIRNIYDSLKKILYYRDKSNLESIEEYDLTEILTYPIKSENITNVQSDDNNYSYGYIKKEIFDKQLNTIFGNNNQQIIQKFENIKNNPKNNIFYFPNAGDKFKRGILEKQENDSYYFKFYGGDGTWAYATMKSIPIKLIEVRKINNYLLLVSKAVYTSYSKDSETASTATINVYKDFALEDKIDQFQISVSEKNYEVDINKYLDSAENVYLALKADNKGNYHFYESKSKN